MLSEVIISVSQDLIGGDRCNEVFYPAAKEEPQNDNLVWTSEEQMTLMATEHPSVVSDRGLYNVTVQYRAIL